MPAAASFRQLLAAARVLLALTLVTGIAYPLLITAAAQVLSPGNANGSRERAADGRVIGSSLIGQPFGGAQWFHPRPSAAGEDGYDTLSSSASNLGPNNPALSALVRERREAYAREQGITTAQVPADAVTASGSGLDPHISPQNARLQARRVARARGLDPARLLRLVDRTTQGRTLGVLGDPRVNVLQLNRALEALR